MNLRQVWRRFWTRNGDLITDKKEYKSKEKIPKNIYDNKTRGEHLTMLNRFHMFFKYRLIIPGIYVAKKILGKCFTKDKTKEPQNINLKVFDVAFEKSLKEWAMYYMLCHESKLSMDGLFDEDILEEKIKQKMSSSCFNILRDMKELVLTGAYYDGAYKELFNILMHNITREMIKAHKGKKVKHLLYTEKNIYDVEYQMHWKNIGKRKLATVGVSKTNEKS